MTDMGNKYLGIDLGTSSIKLLLKEVNGKTVTVKKKYESPAPIGWLDALKSALWELKSQVDTAEISAIGLSSQVGSYLTDTGEVLSWNDNIGKEELCEIKRKFSRETFLSELDMDHPDLISYPLPRLLYIKRHFPNCKKVIMPKELIAGELTDKISSDVFSWRGLAHTKNGKYSQKLLDSLGIDFELPPLFNPTDKIGCVTEFAAQKYGLKEGTPVFAGCNDFFAGLLGMGVLENGSFFELSGTSEHIGSISDSISKSSLISGRFFENFVTYGGTKASGVSCSFAMDNFGLNGVTASEVLSSPPIFLPYLTGERAPIYDENARGVFFGINGKTDSKALAYSVLEGVVFSLFDIAQNLDTNGSTRLITGGGSAQDSVMAKLKAELWGVEIAVCEENDTSALGAAMLAMVGNGEYASLSDAIEKTVCYKTIAKPSGEYKEILLKRFEIYKNLYKNLKQSFDAFSAL